MNEENNKIDGNSTIDQEQKQQKQKYFIILLNFIFNKSPIIPTPLTDHGVHNDIFTKLTPDRVNAFLPGLLNPSNNTLLMYKLDTACTFTRGYQSIS